jgi:hypothetical protein
VSALSTRKFLRRSFGICAALGATLAIGPASASAADLCTPSGVSQPFLEYGDSAWYSIVPGQTRDNVDGTGWDLSGGASVTSTTLAKGKTGQALKLPVNGRAVSPPMCVNNTYPYLRSMVSSTTQGSAKVYVSYLGPTGWGSPKSFGTLLASGTAWQLSPKVKFVLNSISGWQQAQLTLVGTGPKPTSNARIYNLYADPRMRR